MANDNNITGNVNLLSTTPRLGRGRVPATGQPEFESVLFGLANAAAVFATDAPVGTLALCVDGTAFLKFAAGAANWTGVGAGAATRSLVATLNITISNPSNAFSNGNDLFLGEASTTVTAPFAGTYLAQLTGQFDRNGALSGIQFNQTLVFQFTVNGTNTGALGLLTVSDTDRAAYSLSFPQELTLAAGDTVGAEWGFGAVQATSIGGAFASRALSITPVNA